VITDFGAELATGAADVPEPHPGRSPSASACAPYREAIELALSRGRNAMAIWQDPVDTCGFAVGYQSVRRKQAAFRDHNRTLDNAAQERI
jgi:hypothetical protein